MADFTPHHHHPIATANGYSRRREPRRKNHYSAGGGVILRRCIRCWVVVPPVYVLGLIVCACTVSIILYDSSRVPGSVYRSHDVFLKVWDEIRSDNSTPIELSTIWRYKKLKNQKGCEFTPTRQDAIAHSGYLIVEANGGLNQQRSSICNAVAVAGILNATLLVPHFEYHNVWQDRSEFGDIYDKDHFISTLDGFVKVVPELPRTLLEQYDYNISNVPVTQVRAWAPVSYYLEEIYPILQNQGLVRIAPFANRLAMSVPPHIQFLRCLANYKALRFALPISTLAKKIIDQMMEKSSRSDGKYVSVHLRFEEDMIAFSGCVYEGGRREQFEMDVVRERGWRDKFRRRGRKINPGLNRLNGKCPLTPVEVGMMLRGMGFGNDTSIYLASGKLYKEERHLAPLLQIFPLLYTKESLATPEELAPLKAYSSRMAAVDYGVCLFSEVFLTTQGGNFPHFLMGHRRFLYGGHAKTINPNKLKLVPLFKDTNISWTDIKEQVTPMLDESNREGRAEAIISKSNRKTSVYKHPFPACRCLEGAQNLTLSRTHVHDLLDHQLFSVI